MIGRNDLMGGRRGFEDAGDETGHRPAECAGETTSGMWMPIVP